MSNIKLFNPFRTISETENPSHYKISHLVTKIQFLNYKLLVTNNHKSSLEVSWDFITGFRLILNDSKRTYEYSRIFIPRNSVTSLINRFLKDDRINYNRYVLSEKYKKQKLFKRFIISLWIINPILFLALIVVYNTIDLSPRSVTSVVLVMFGLASSFIASLHLNDYMYFRGKHPANYISI